MEPELIPLAFGGFCYMGIEKIMSGAKSASCVLPKKQAEGESIFMTTCLFSFMGEEYEDRHLEFNKAQIIDANGDVIPVKAIPYEGEGSMNTQFCYTNELLLNFSPGLQARYDALEEVKINIRSKLMKDKKNGRRGAMFDDIDIGQNIVLYNNEEPQEIVQIFLKSDLCFCV